VAEGGGLLNRYTLQRRIEGSNPSVSARTPGFESFLGGDAWKLIRVPLQDTAAGLQLARLGGPVAARRSLTPISAQTCDLNSVLKLLKIRTYTLLA
jgi:hypothetical protein